MENTFDDLIQAVPRLFERAEIDSNERSAAHFCD